MVLVYGLAVAPVLHAVVGHGSGRAATAARAHAHGDVEHTHAEHSHGGDADPSHGKGPGQHEHAPGSVEHLWTLAEARAEVLAPAPRWVALSTGVDDAPLRLPGARLRLTEQPQGP